MKARQKILVTGASAGIGKAIAEHLAAAGHHVIGTSRNPEKYPKCASYELVPLDLDDDDSITQCAAAVGDVDVLINNAGISQMGAVEDVADEKLRHLFAVNFFGPVKMIRLLAPCMRTRRSGRIINIGSLIDRFPLPFQSSYAASKAALHCFSNSLYNEMRAFNIAVSYVGLYHVNTDIVCDVVCPSDSAYAVQIRNIGAQRRAAMHRAVSPAHVAKAIAEIATMKRPRPAYTIGVPAHFLTLLTKWIPESVLLNAIARYAEGAPRR